jgi:DNA replication and repair protein RecF
MQLTGLELYHLRNIAQARLEPAAGLNVIAGPNASGKTSLLEAIYLLGRGRSFRTRCRDALIQGGHNEFMLRAELLQADSVHRLACQMSLSSRRIRFDGSDIKRSADLAHILPLQFINQQSLELVDRGPAPRRKFLDWGVFHVEPAFFTAWQRYQRVLQQRNAALRQRQPVNHWNPEFVAAAEGLHGHRHAYLQAFEQAFIQTCALLLDMPITLRYNPGWDTSQPLQTVLTTHLRSDQRRRFTQSGPHRADLLLQFDGQPAVERLSRGQQKLLVAALALAQAQLYSTRTGQACLVLVDDLTAELDVRHVKTLLDALLDTGAQLFVTVTDAGLLSDVKTASQRLFHVEQGRFRCAEVV